MSESISKNEDVEGVEGVETEADGKYSLDEMVRALRDGERDKDEQGELVTREDGTVVRRVKRRKRRSDQSKKKKKEEREKRALVYQILGLVGVVVLIAAYLGFLFFRLNSSSYREGIGKNVSQWLGAEVTLNGLSVSPSSASMNSMEMDWGEDSYLADLKMSHLTADTRVKDFLLGKFRGIDLGGRRGEMTVQLPDSNAQVVKPFAVNDYPYSFDLYYCDSLAVSFGEESPLSLQKVNASYRYLTGSGHQAVLNGGVLKMEGWKPFPIENGTLMFQKDAVNLVGLSLQDPDLNGGEMNLSGSIPLQKDAEYHLNLSSDNFGVGTLLGENFGSLFSGRLRTEQGVVNFKQGDAEPQSVVVPFIGERLSMKRFPFLGVLDELFPEEGFLNPVFDDGGSAVFQWSPQGVGLKSIKFRQSSKMIVSGHILAARDGLLIGKLTLRLNKGILARQAIFANNPGLEVDDDDTGYAVVHIKLGGTISEPSDNFRDVIGMNSSLNPAPSEKADRDFESLFNELTE